MTEQKYVALRLRRGASYLDANVRSVRDRGAMFGAPLGAVLSADDVRLDLHALEVDQISSRDVHKLHEDDSYIAVAEEMPIALIEPNSTGPASAVGEAWGVGAVLADASPFTGEGATVAVLDTGIDENHAAFRGVNLAVKDFTGVGPGDQVGHGTHCAGTIFGQPVNGVRIGVAPGVKQAFIAKVIGRNATTSTLVDALQWVIENEVDVISMSLGIDYPGYVARQEQADVPLRVAVSQALVAYRNNLRMFDTLMELLKARAILDEGSLVCAASGNESQLDAPHPYRISCSIPAASVDVISVGALRKTDAGRYATAAFSNIDPTVCAPGVDVTSASLNGGLEDMSGTSMACPHVAGVTALWWQAMRSVSPRGRTSARQVEANLLASVRRVPQLHPQHDPLLHGLGLVTAPLR